MAEQTDDTGERWHLLPQPTEGVGGLALDDAPPWRDVVGVYYPDVGDVRFGLGSDDVTALGWVGLDAGVDCQKLSTFGHRIYDQFSQTPRQPVEGKMTPYLASHHGSNVIPQTMTQPQTTTIEIAPVPRAGHTTTPAATAAQPRLVEPSSTSCLLTCLCGSLFGLVLLAYRVSAICFAVSGAVFLSQEYRDIPSCASSYEGWAIALTVLYGLTALNSNKDSNQSSGAGSLDNASTVYGWTCLILAIPFGVTAGLGHRDVLTQADDCDVSGISKLETWTTWIVIYNTVGCGLLLLGGTALLLCS